MKRILGRGTMAALPILILMGACSSEPVGVTDLSDDQQINLDVARYVADVTGDDILLMTYEADFVMRRDFGRAAAEGGEQCNRGMGKQFRCKGGVFGGGFGSGSMSYTREVTFYDIEDAPMDWYDATETASINFYVSMSGERSSEWGSMTVNRERDFTVSGLYEDETSRIWNGWGKSDRNRTRYSDEKGDRTYDMSDTTTVTNVVIPVPRSWPEDGGTIERTVNVEIVKDGETRTKIRDVLIVFNGTQYVPITVNDETYTLDLATRTIDRGDT